MRPTLFLVLLAACAGAEVAPSVVPPGAPASLSFDQGTGQSGEVHQALAVTIGVKVLDAKDQAVPQQLINWVIVKGGGSTFVGATLTNDQGEAQNQWTLGDTAGIQSLEARAIDSVGAPIVIQRLDATAIPGPLAQRGWLKDSLRVAADTVFDLPAFARDAYGNELTVQGLVQLDGPGHLNGMTWSADSLGLAHFLLGNDTLRAWSDLPAGHFEAVYHVDTVTYYESADLVQCSPGASPCNAGGPDFDGKNWRAWRSDSAAEYGGDHPNMVTGDFFGIYPGNPINVAYSWPGGPNAFGTQSQLLLIDHHDRTFVFANGAGLFDTVTVTH
jgi:hypothetical protein